ncbi:restriction endonuclease subunit S [Rhodococcus marinonascens]|uniref:restriction endonuclease subunit S n=1 Tax=Rhodococcus marinonascens TaxID=38311 RepID=UPI0009FCD514|nr:restriction endonuclease subunit S [Rhodococcus marinonascens]
MAIVDCEHKTAPIDESGDYFAVGTPAMRDGVIDYSQARRISRDTFDAWTRRMRPKTGDLLFAREAPVGPIVRVPDEENVAPGQRTVLLRPDAERVNSEYLFYLLGSRAMQRQFHERAAGSTVLHLNVADVRTFKLAALPTIAEQRAIAEILGALDDKIAANRKLIRTADALALTLVRSRLSDSATVAVSEVALVTMGQSPPGESFNEEGNGTVFYQGNRDFGFRSPTNRLWTVDPKRMAQAGDTLMSVRAPVGELNVATEPTCIGRGLASLRSEVGQPSILFHTLKASSRLWEPFESGGTVFGSINGKELNNLQIPVCEGNLEELETGLSELDSVVRSAEAESQTLAVTRDALLPRLMSGELRVRDAERQVEEML